MNCSDISNTPDQGISVYNRFHILDPIDSNGDNEQSVTTDNVDCYHQSCPKNNNSIWGKTNKANMDLSGRTCTSEKLGQSQQYPVCITDSHQDKAVISAQRDICNTEPCTEFLLCQQQLDTAFGCIPLTAIKIYKGPVKIWSAIPDLFTAHNMIKDSRVPNFLGLRIPVNTNLNVHAWRKYLRNYFYQQLVNLIEYSFPLDFDRTRKLVNTLQNHASARNYLSHVDRYIQEELAHNAVIGPLDHKPLMYMYAP